MCNQNDDPSMHDLVIVVRSTCDRILWARGEPYRCGQTIGLETWTDEGGYNHAGCRFHVAEMRHRHPEPVAP